MLPDDTPARVPTAHGGRCAAADTTAGLVAASILGAGLYFAFVEIDRWASRAFAQPQLASMLVTVIDLALGALALCLAPALSRLIRRLTARRKPAVSEGTPP